MDRESMRAIRLAMTVTLIFSRFEARGFRYVEIVDVGVDRGISAMKTVDEILD